MSGFSGRGNNRLANYSEVKHRIPEFWARYPEGQIVTEILHHDLERVVVQCKVYRTNTEHRPAAVGHAEEQRTTEPKKVNTNNAVENCFAVETEILTVAGWRNIGEFVSKRTTDAVASLVAGSIEFAVPLAWIEREANELITIEDSRTRQRVTPEHRVLVGTEYYQARALYEREYIGGQWVDGIIPQDDGDVDGLHAEPGRHKRQYIWEKFDTPVPVYCLTMPEGNIVTRNNGKIAVSGNCETSAIGRALANMGITLAHERPSVEEIQKDARHAGDTPLAARRPGYTMPPQDDASLLQARYVDLLNTARTAAQDGLALSEIKTLFVKAREWMTPTQLENSRTVYREIEQARQAAVPEQVAEVAPESDRAQPATEEPVTHEGDSTQERDQKGKRGKKPAESNGESK